MQTRIRTIKLKHRGLLASFKRDKTFPENSFEREMGKRAYFTFLFVKSFAQPEKIKKKKEQQRDCSTFFKVTKRKNKKKNSQQVVTRTALEITAIIENKAEPK